MITKNKIKISAILSFFIIVCVICVSCFIKTAYATTNGDDKLYGETLNQRNMSVKDCPNISGKYSILINKNGDIIYERASEEHAKIASLTKIMTAIVALENCDLNELVTINKKAVEIGESSAGFWVDDKLDMQSALYAMLVPSGNDAAEAICEHIGKKLVESKDDKIRLKSEQDVESEAQENNIDKDDVKDIFITDNDKAFCKLMNDKAIELGCNNTNFTNPHGLDDEEFFNENQYSCAKDIAMITKYAMQNDLFRKIVGGGDTKINIERNGSIIKLNLTSTDILVGNFDGCVGVKTGNSDMAGACFSGACVDSRDSDEIYTIVLKADNETERFIDTQNLFNWYLTNKTCLNLSNTGVVESMKINNDESVDVGVVAYLAHNDWVDCKFPVTLEDRNQTVPVLGIAGNIHLKIEPESAKGNIKAGDKVAEIVLTQHNREIARLNLVSVKDQASPNIFQMIGVAFDRLGRNITGQPTVADTELLANCDTINNQNKK